MRIKYVTKLEFELLLAEQEINRRYVTYNSGAPKHDKILVVDNQGSCQIMPAPTELIEALL